MRELASVEAPYRGSRAFPRRKAAKNDSAAELRSQTLRSPDLPANIFGEMLRDVLASAPVPQKEIPALKETGFLSEGSSTFAMHGTIAKVTKSIRFSTRSISAAAPAMMQNLLLISR